MKRFLQISLLLVSAAILSLLLYSACGKDKATPTDPNANLDEWTILSYGAGNNNLDYSQGGTSYVIEDVQEMEKIGSSDKVNIIAMVASLRTGGNAKYYYIEQYPDDLGDNISSTILEDMGGKDMSDANTLKDFLVYGITNYPAKKYMVIIDDHGSGWRGSCSDEQNGSGNVMTMYEMANAVESAKSTTGIGNIDIFNFHCCLMSQVEVAYELRNCADYMLGSEFVMPMESIFGCVEWLGNLVANPTTAPLDLAKNIVTAVDNSARAKQKLSHFAVTDLSEMSRLAARLDHLGTQLRTTANAYWWEVYQAWFSSWNTDYDDPSFIDIRDFCNKVKQQPNLQNINLVSDAADSVIAVINDAVKLTKTNVVGVTRGGMTIHMPYLIDMYDSTNYARLGFQNTGWTNFLSIYIHGLEPFLGNSLTVNVDPANGGAVAVNPDLQSYQQGDTVTLTATAANGYLFDHFSDGTNNFTSNPFAFTFPDGNLTMTAYFVVDGGGGSSATISGTISWPGHTLSNFTYAFADTASGASVYLVEQATVNPSTGSYTITINNMTSSMNLLFEAQDDVNNSQPWYPDAGDGWGYYDADSDGSWTVNDAITVYPGNTISGANITLITITLSSQQNSAFDR